MNYIYDREQTEEDKFKTQQIKALTEAYQSGIKKEKHLNKRLMNLLTLRLVKTKSFPNRREILQSYEKK